MKQIKAVVVGAGDRGNIYCSYSLSNPDKMKIVGIVDPDPVRTQVIKERYNVPEENCFASVEEFVKRDKFADAVINGTMDHLHVPTSIPILKKGYDMLLEKPFAINEEEMMELVKVANEEGRKVVIGHVLRYAPFYKAIKEHVMNGDIGQIISIEMAEHVGYDHIATSYVRGKWRSEETCCSNMLLAKCCHDIDIMMWLMKGIKPVSVASFGSDLQFGKKNKPADAADRCLECPHEKDCRFSAYPHYIEYNVWQPWAFKCLEAEGQAEELSDERKIESLKTDNPYGECVWNFDRGRNVDHQSVIVNFENGATGVFNMAGGTAKRNRTIYINGTHGEIEGSAGDLKYTVRKLKPGKDSMYTEEEYKIDLGADKDISGHGGGDSRLTADFVEYINGMEPSVSCTDINDSTLSHLVVFRAEKSRMNGTIEKIDL